MFSLHFCNGIGYGTQSNPEMFKRLFHPLILSSKLCNFCTSFLTSYNSTRLTLPYLLDTSIILYRMSCVIHKADDSLPLHNWVKYIFKGVLLLHSSILKLVYNECFINIWLKMQMNNDIILIQKVSNSTVSCLRRESLAE